MSIHSKTSNRHSKMLPALLLLLLFEIPLLAGVVFEVETKDHEHSPPRVDETRMQAEGRNLKMGITARKGGSQGEMIFRGEQREMLVIDHGKKTYFVINQETIDALTDQISQVMDQMEKALKKIPEDQREMAEKMMKHRMPQQAPQRPSAELRKTSERANRNGYPCVKYEVLRTGNKVRELWVTDWDKVEGGREVAQTFSEMADFFTEWMKSVTQVSGALADPSDHLENSVFVHMRELNGFPVVTRDLGEDGSLGKESNLRSARRQTLDPAEFEPPAGYKRQEMPGNL